MITRTDTLDQVRPLTNAERLALYHLRSNRAEVTNEYRRRYEYGVRFKRALHDGHPGRVTGIYGELEDAPRENVIELGRHTA